MPRVCKGCGCACEGCFASSNSLDLQHQIEELQSQLIRSHAHISNMEHEYVNSRQVTDYEILKLRDELVKLRDRYERLLESHKRIQRVNHSLEEKLLKVVTTSEAEKTNMQKEVASLTSKLVDAKAAIGELEEENERFRTDCNLAVQLLHCRPSSFVSQRLTTLPLELQDRVKGHMTSEQIINMENDSQARETTKLIRVPMQTFPPTAMVYSVPAAKNNREKEIQNSNRPDSVPLTLIAKVLTQPESKRKQQRTYLCVGCKGDFTFANKEVQTVTPVYRDIERGGNSHMKIHGYGRTRTSSTETEI